MSNTWSRLRLIVLFILIAASPALAASGDTARQPMAGVGLFMTLAIVYLSRRRAIGGWLLYFYVQLYLSLAFFLIFIYQTIVNLNPKQWENSFLYVMFFLSVVPVLIAGVVEVIVATKLLIRRNERNLKILRNTLLALVVTSAVALGIDIAYFRESPLFFDGLTLAFAVIWAIYFSKSERVKSVFIDRQWVYIAASHQRVLTPDDKRILRKRVLIIASATFFVFLLLMGFGSKGEAKQLDMSILLVPLFYALLAALFSWFWPIRRKNVCKEVIKGVKSKKIIKANKTRAKKKKGFMNKVEEIGKKINDVLST